MKTSNKYIAILIVGSTLTACGGGGGGNSGNNTPTPSPIAATVIDFSQAQQFATPQLDEATLASTTKLSTNLGTTSNSCFSINSPNFSLGTWWASGSFNVYNSCSTMQSASGLQLSLSSTNYALQGSSFSLNSVNNLYFPPPVYWAPSTITATTVASSDGYSDLLLTLNTTGYIQPNSFMNISFGYNSNGSLPGAMTASVSGATPIQNGTINLTINATSLKSICSGTTTCNIPIVLAGQGGQFESTVATITNSNAGTIVSTKLINLNPSSYTLSAKSGSLPPNVSFSAPPITLNSGATINESAVFTVQAVTTGNLNLTIAKPNNINSSESYVSVKLVNSSGVTVGMTQAVYGQITSFSALTAGNYTVQAYGLADAINGIYYSPLNKAFTITANQTTNLSTQFTANTTTTITENLVVSGLDSGDQATITLTDNYNGSQYKFNALNRSNGTTALKLLPGDLITLNVSASSKYKTINPATYTAQNNATITLTFNKVPPVSKVFSPYKDVATNANWNNLVMSTMVNSTTLTPLVNALPSGVKTVTWAFATGECGSENWGGINAAQFATANVPNFVAANKNYIVSTGGAAGIFTCSSNSGMDTFIKRYNSQNLIGFDFDIEGGQTTAQIQSLIKQLVYIQGKYPNLRISFTLATLASSDGSYGGLNSLGDLVIKTAQAAGLNFYVDLMVMDYGYTGASNCVVVNNKCDMYQSAVQAVTNLQHTYAIPINHIEVTPMIGDNDTADEVFTVGNATSLAQYVVNNGLAGLHYWSYDRDTPCPSGTNYASAICSYVPGVTTIPLQFTNAFIAGGLGN